MFKNLRHRLAVWFPLSLRDFLTMLLILFAAVMICSALQRSDPSASLAMPVFVLAVLLTSFFTNGYFFGLLSSLLGVFCVNYIG